MTLTERLDLDAPISMRQLLDGARPAIDGASPVTLAEYTEEILRSGFSGVRGLTGRARRVRLDGYLECGRLTRSRA